MQIVKSAYSLKYGLITRKVIPFAGLLNVCQNKFAHEGPSMGKLLNKGLYIYKTHNWPVPQNRPIPTTGPVLKSWP